MCGSVGISWGRRGGRSVGSARGVGVGPGHFFNQGIPPMGPMWSFSLAHCCRRENPRGTPKNRAIGVGLRAESRVIEGAKELHRHRHCRRPPVSHRPSRRRDKQGAPSPSPLYGRLRRLGFFGRRRFQMQSINPILSPMVSALFSTCFIFMFGALYVSRFDFEFGLRNGGKPQVPPVYLVLNFIC